MCLEYVYFENIKVLSFLELYLKILSNKSTQALSFVNPYTCTRIHAKTYTNGITTTTTSNKLKLKQ